MSSLAVFALLVAGAGYAYIQYRFHQIHRVSVAALEPIVAKSGQAAAPYNVLLVGDNCRNCLDGKQTSAFGSAADVGGGRSDVTMLLHVDPSANHVSILSIPRDLWLPIPNSSDEIRVDASLNNGPTALVSTIEDALNIPINHYVELNFDTFQDVVNAIGGINIDFPTRFYDAYSQLNAPPGCYHLDGAQALALVRARHSYYQVDGQWQYDGLGDISRIARDHEFLRVLASAVSAQGLGNPVTDNRLIGAVAKDLTIDSTFSLGSLAGLAETLSRVNLANAPQTTLPVDEDNSPQGYVYRGVQYGDVVFPTNTGDRAAIAAFLGGAPEGGALPANALPVRVVNGSGISGQQGQVATQLRPLGFIIAGTSVGSVASTPSESVVYYGPGHEGSAQRLADELGGAVALGQNATIAGTGLTLVTGSNVTVAVAPKPVTKIPSSASAAGRNRTTTATPVQPPTATEIGGITATNPTYPSFDPRSCLPGASTPPLPTLPVPDSSSLPST